MLVETKLYAPSARKEWVPRTELIRGLTGGTAKLVLVGAPAGFGKSTLVAQWGASAAEARPFAWISLDPGDGDPGRLWWHLACAAQRAGLREGMRLGARGGHAQILITSIPGMAS